MLKEKNPKLLKTAEIQSFPTSELFELIGMDFLHLEKASGGYQ